MFFIKVSSHLLIISDSKSSHLYYFSHVSTTTHHHIPCFLDKLHNSFLHTKKSRAETYVAINDLPKQKYVH